MKTLLFIYLFSCSWHLTSSCDPSPHRLYILAHPHHRVPHKHLHSSMPTYAQFPLPSHFMVCVKILTVTVHCDRSMKGSMKKYLTKPGRGPGGSNSTGLDGQYGSEVQVWFPGAALSWTSNIGASGWLVHLEVYLGRGPWTQPLRLLCVMETDSEASEAW